MNTIRKIRVHLNWFCEGSVSIMVPNNAHPLKIAPSPFSEVGSGAGDFEMLWAIDTDRPLEEFQIEVASCEQSMKHLIGAHYVDSILDENNVWRHVFIRPPEKTPMCEPAAVAVGFDELPTAIQDVLVEELARLERMRNESAAAGEVHPDASSGLDIDHSAGSRN